MPGPKISKRKEKVSESDTKYRALTDMSLRQSPDPKSPKYEQWHKWPEGTVFSPPPHMNVARALERGIIEPVGKAPVFLLKKEEVSDDDEE